MPPPRPRRRWKILFAALLLSLVIASSVLATLWRGWMSEGAALGKAHAAFSVSHPGWSFPARVRSSSVALDSVTPARAIAEAKIRGYTEVCPSKAPGTFCTKSQTVTPRTPPTLEPIELGWLVGPDGELRIHLPLADAPKMLTDAIIASEDRAFRSHDGVRFSAVLRAVFANSKDRGYSQGASTLTMQVVRNLNQRTEKTLGRKLKEMALAMGLERGVGKDEVLQMYLDAPYLGQWGSYSVCGFAEAAQHYFAKAPKDLSLAQTATLVGMLPAPGKYAPDLHPVASKQRRNKVLNAMHQVFGYDVKDALEEPLHVEPAEPLPERFPAYLSALRQSLESTLSDHQLHASGLIVETGLDAVMQNEAEQLFPQKTLAFEMLLEGRSPAPLQAVGVALDVKTGLVRAVYGGNGTTATGFNRATQAHRQPGSSFKPLVYALAFMQKTAGGARRFTAASTEPNSPREFKTPQGSWRPNNVGGESTPTAALAQGLAWSQNIATASLLEDIGGPEPLIALAGKVGFDTRAFPEELGLALGQAEVTPLEMATMAATIANGGFRLEPSPVLRATDLRGNEVLTPPQPRERVIDATAAALTRELMRLVVDVGTGGALRGIPGEAGYSGPAIGKTGTTDAEKDLWFVGSTPKTAAVVWLGFDTPARVGAAAADLAAPLWGYWVGHSTAVDGVSKEEFVGDVKLVKQGICTETGKLPNASCKVIYAPFVPGTQPTEACDVEHSEEASAAKYESIWTKRDRAANPPPAADTAEPADPPPMAEEPGEGASDDGTSPEPP